MPIALQVPLLLMVFWGGPRQTSVAQDAPECTIRFSDVTNESGIRFQHTHGGSGMGYIVEGMSTGLATFDYDGDGLIDIYFLNGAALKGTEQGAPSRNALYRNNGDWTFTDVTQESGTGDTGYALGVTVADYDGDGDADIYISNFGPNVLLRNNGDKTFTDVTAEAGVGNGNQVGAGVAFLDIDGDDDLDLYAANYVDFTYANHVPILIQGKRFRAGPQYYKAVPDSLFRNEGDGTFTDVSRDSGITSVTGPGMGVVCADFDQDKDIDIYVCNDGQPNFLFQNDGKGHFEEAGLLMGAACDFSGKANSSMGVDCGDYNRDGLLDLFVTDYQAEMPVLYRNVGGGFFEDATSTASITHDLFPHVGWGTGFVDFDSDEDADLFVACGHFDRIEEIDDRTAKKISNFLLMNVGNRYVDVTQKAGEGLAVVASSRGAVFDDLDNDGDVDIVIVNSGAAPTVLRNESKPVGQWLQIRLQQDGMNRNAVGARVSVTTQSGTQVSAVVAGRGYQSYFGERLYFATTDASKVVSVDVTWPDGQTSQQKATVGRLNTLSR